MVVHLRLDLGSIASVKLLACIKSPSTVLGTCFEQVSVFTGPNSTCFYSCRQIHVSFMILIGIHRMTCKLWLDATGLFYCLYCLVHMLVLSIRSVKLALASVCSFI
jgi:hypothetical protein